MSCSENVLGFSFWFVANNRWNHCSRTSYITNDKPNNPIVLFIMDIFVTVWSIIILKTRKKVLVVDISIYLQHIYNIIAGVIRWQSHLVCVLVKFQGRLRYLKVTFIVHMVTNDLVDKWYSIKQKMICHVNITEFCVTKMRYMASKNATSR